MCNIEFVVTFSCYWPHVRHRVETRATHREIFPSLFVLCSGCSHGVLVMFCCCCCIRSLLYYGSLQSVEEFVPQGCLCFSARAKKKNVLIKRWNTEKSAYLWFAQWHYFNELIKSSLPPSLPPRGSPGVVVAQVQSRHR